MQVLFIGSHIYYICRGRSGWRFSINVYSCMAPKDFKPLTLTAYGNWWPMHQVSLQRKGCDLQGARIRATYINQDNLFTLTETDGNPVPEGYFGKIWITLQEKLNFTTEYVPSRDGYYGSLMKGGQFNGMVNMLQTGEVDAVCSNMFMNSKRTQAVDFLHPILNERTYVFIREPDVIEMEWNDFIRPFSSELWFSIALVFMLIAFSLWSTSQSLRDSIFAVLASFCMQNQVSAECKAACRIVLVTSYVTALVLLAGYSGSLISTLTSRGPVLPFTDFQGILGDGTYQVWTLPNTAPLDNIKFSTDPTVRRLYSELMEPNAEGMPQTDEEAISRLCGDGKFAYLTEYQQAMSTPLSCKVTPVPDAFFPATLSMALTKRSPYRKLFNFYLQEMRRSGILQRLQLHTLTTQLQEAPPGRRVDLEQIAPVFSIFLLGITFSLVFLMAEIFIDAKKRSRRRIQTILT